MASMTVHQLASPDLFSPDLLPAFAHLAKDLRFGLGSNDSSIAVDVLLAFLDDEDPLKCSLYSIQYLLVLRVVELGQFLFEDVAADVVEEVLLEVLLHYLLLLINFIKNALVEGVEGTAVVVDAQRGLLGFLTTASARTDLLRGSIMLPTRSILWHGRHERASAPNLVQLGNHSQAVMLLCQLAGQLATALKESVALLDDPESVCLLLVQVTLVELVEVLHELGADLVLLFRDKEGCVEGSVDVGDAADAFLAEGS